MYIYFATDLKRKYRKNATPAALRLALAEMYVQGVSTKRVKAVTAILCGYEVSSSEVSRASKLMDEEQEKWRNRPLGAFKYMIIDAIYEKERSDGCELWLIF